VGGYGAQGVTGVTLVRVVTHTLQLTDMELRGSAIHPLGCITCAHTLQRLPSCPFLLPPPPPPQMVQSTAAHP
jgi:hypothetical protein